MAYTIQGQKIFKKIKEWVSDYEAKSEDAADAVYDLENKISTLDNEREQVIVNLANIYLSDMTAKSVESSLKELRGNVKALFESKQEHRKELEQLMKECLQNRDQTTSEIGAVTEKLNDAADRRDELRDSLSKELMENPAYVELDQKAQQASAKLTVYERRVKEVTKLAQEKLPAYKKDKLFMYLVNKGYDPVNNRGRGIIARLDAIVAGIVNYTAEKKKYDYLTSMPKLMNMEVELRKQELGKVTLKLKKIEAEKAKEAGLPEVIANGLELENYRKSLIEQKSSAESKFADYKNQRAELDNEKGHYHTEAIQLYKKFLKGAELDQLKDVVRRTPDTKDDHYLARMVEIDDEIRQLKNHVKDARTERDNVENLLEGFQSIQTYFDSKDYESNRSYFKSGFDMVPYLQGYIDEDYSISEIKNALANNQYTKPVESYGSSSYSRSRRTYNDDDDDDDNDIFSSIKIPTFSSKPSGGGGGWNFGGGGSISIGSGFGGGGGGSSSKGSGW